MADPSAKLFVGCLPYSKTEADLTPIFDQYGPLVEVALLRKPDGSSKGAAFVVYQDPENAQAAMTNLQNYTFPDSNRGLNISISGSKGGGGGGQHVGNVVPPPPRRPQAAQRQVPAQYAPMTPSHHQGAYANQPPPPPGSPAGGAEVPGSKIFIGQLPYSKSDQDLWQLFGSIGPVAEVVLMVNKETGEKKGAAFVRYHSATHAAAACAALDGFTFTNSTRPITVSIARSDGPRRGGGPSAPNPQSVIASLGTQAPGAAGVGHYAPPSRGGYGAAPMPSAPDVEGAKLFVGQLPFSRNELEIKEVFQQYGPVTEVFLHRDAQGQKKGACFVKYTHADHAVMALEMDGYTFQGATRPITVMMAEDGGGPKRRRFA